MRNRLDSIAARMPSPFPRDSRGLAMFATLLAVAANLVSVFAAGIFRGLAFALAATVWARSRPRSLPWTTAVLPGLCFIAWTLVAAVASPQPMHDLAILKKTYLMMWLLLVPFLFRDAVSLPRVYGGICLVAALASAAGIVQYGLDPERDLLHRISGFLGHWMAYSGVLMIVLVVLVASSLCYVRGRWWKVSLLLLVGCPLLLTETRNAWIGAVAGAFAVVALLRPRATPVVLAVVAAIYLANPANVQERVKAAFNANDATTSGRVELLRTSVAMIRDNPVLGVGPKSVSTAALRYRTTSEFPDHLYQHMHNNVLQIAAERGIPGLLLWLWFMFRLAWDAWSVYRGARGDESRRDALFAGASALGAWVAFMAAGMAEYNFGDSEVFSLFIFTASVPYAFLPFGREFPAAAQGSGVSLTSRK